LAESRNAKPKQFLELVGVGSMLAQTVERISGFAPLCNSPVFVSTRSEYADLVATVLPLSDNLRIIAEPAPQKVCQKRYAVLSFA